MQVQHAKLEAAHIVTPFAVRLGALAVAVAVVGAVLLQAASVAAGIVA